MRFYLAPKLPAPSLDRATIARLDRIESASLTDCRLMLRKRNISRQVRAALYARIRKLEEGAPA